MDTYVIPIQRPVELPTDFPCVTCGGNATVDKDGNQTSPFPCPTCKGYGEVLMSWRPVAPVAGIVEAHKILQDKKLRVGYYHEKNLQLWCAASLALDACIILPEEADDKPKSKNPTPKHRRSRQKTTLPRGRQPEPLRQAQEAPPSGS